MPFRRATSEDAIEMAELVNIAGDGLPLYLWAKFAGPDESPWEVGQKRARNGSGGFAYDYTVVREEKGKVAACLIGYPLTAPSAPDGTIANVLTPLLELERLVPHTFYIMFSQPIHPTEERVMVVRSWASMRTWPRSPGVQA